MKAFIYEKKDKEFRIFFYLCEEEEKKIQNKAWYFNYNVLF